MASWRGLEAASSLIKPRRRREVRREGPVESTFCIIGSNSSRCTPYVGMSSVKSTFIVCRNLLYMDRVFLKFISISIAFPEFLKILIIYDHSVLV